CDVYSVGVVLWEMIAGTRMWKDVPPTDALRRVMLGDLPSLRRAAPTVPAELERICNKALALRPEDRYPTATAFAHDVERYLDAGHKKTRRQAVGEALQAMFASERIQLKAAIERELKRPSLSPSSRLPKLALAATGTDATTGTGAAPDESSEPKTGIVS